MKIKQFTSKQLIQEEIRKDFLKNCVTNLYGLQYTKTKQIQQSKDPRLEPTISFF